MKTTNRLFAALGAAALLIGLGVSGCGDDNGNTDSAVVRDLSGVGTLDLVTVDMAVPNNADLSPLPPDLGFDKDRNCYPAPGNVHIEIINACTDAQKIAKTPKATYLDGGCCPSLP